MSTDSEFQIDPIYVEKLFAHVYWDLKSRSEVRSENRLYHQLNMARLVRQLLIDGNGLFNLVNSYHRLPIRFVIPTCGPTPENVEGIPSLYEGNTPDLAQFPEEYYLHPHKLDGFLAYSPMLLAGRSFSVREIVKYVANEFGGVHLSPYLKGEDDQLLARFNDTLNVGGDGVVLNRIEEIARITVRGLDPLFQKIQEKYDALERSRTSEKSVT